MNRLVLLAGLVMTVPLAGLLYMGLGRDPHKVESPLVGRKAPAFSLVPVGGGPAVSLESLRGKPVVLNFWATWCVPCYQEHPVLVRAAREMGGEVQFLGVVYEDEEKRVADFLKKQGSSYTSVLDDGGKTAIAYGVYGVPETFFISVDGTIVSKFVGPLTVEDLGQLVDRARSGSVVRGASR